MARDGGPSPRGPAISAGMLPSLLGYHLRRAQTAVFRHFAEVVGAREDITPGLFGVMHLVAVNPGLCQSRLAEAVGVDRSTIVSVITDLEARGLVERLASARDRRSHALHLTPKGSAALRRMARLVRRHEAEIAQDFSATELKTLMGLLARLGSRLPGPPGAAPPGAETRSGRSGAGVIPSRAPLTPPRRPRRAAEEP